MSHPSSHRIAAALVTLLAFGGPPLSLAADDEPSAVDVLNGAEIRDLIGVLESETFRDGDFMDLRVHAIDGLRRVVADGGDALRDAALAQVWTGDNEQRKRAQIVLAQLDDLPEAPLRKMLGSALPEIWVWAHVTLRRVGPHDHGLTAEQGVEMTDVSGPLTVTPERVPGDEPIIAVADEIRARVARGPDSLASIAENDPEWIASEYAPVMAAPWRFIPPERRRFVDLDGDGVDEVVVAAVRGWGDHETEYDCDELRFVAVIGKNDENEWQLDAFHRADRSDIFADLVVADLDGDGDDECVLRYDLVAGWCYGMATSITRHSITETVRGSFPDQAVSVVRRPSSDSVHFVAADAYVPMSTGKAAYLCGVMAWEYRIYAWEGGGLEQVGAVYVR